MTKTGTTSFGISLFVLKLIAMAAMVIDHTGNLFFPDQMAWNCVGRLAFPVYCFLIVNGFLHTRNRFGYLARLIVFAFLSQIPYTLMHYAAVRQPLHSLFFEFGDVFTTLNSLFVLSLGLITIMLLDAFRQKDPVLGHLFGLAAAGGITALSWVMHCEYCFLGIPLIVAFYEAELFRKSPHCRNRWLGMAVQLALGTAALGLYVLLVCVTGRNNLTSALIYGACQFGALLFLFLYNGRRGSQNKAVKYCFYCFYPVHMLILLLIHALLFLNF